MHPFVRLSNLMQVFLTAAIVVILSPSASCFSTNRFSTSLWSSATAESMKQSKIASLLDACRNGSSKSLIQTLVAEVSSEPSEPETWLSGTWELVYTPDDLTRTSPFFTAFRQAVPQADQIYDITDAIPSPLKEVGPAMQDIDLEAKSLVSRVKVATLGGQATSIMTTRCTILGGSNNLMLQVDSTKPEDSTIINKLFGPLAESINSNTPPFPSGTALERLQPGSSQVVWKNLYCDEALRISRYGDEDNFCIWTRNEFATFSEL